MDDLVFVHLSDIHFREGHVGSAHDPNRDLRHELELDIRRLRSDLPRVDGILISGDIAFSGSPSEFEYATNWIARLRELVACPPEGVMVTPGNHDIDRTGITRGGPTQILHDSIRAGITLEEKDARLAEALRDPGSRPHMLNPLRAYNDFAKQYGCQVDAHAPALNQRHCAGVAAGAGETGLLAWANLFRSRNSQS